MGRDHRPRPAAGSDPEARAGEGEDVDLALPHRPLDAQPGRGRSHRAARARLRRDRLAPAGLRAGRHGRRPGRRAHLPAGDRPAVAEEHGALARGRRFRVRPVRDRRGPAAHVPGVALRPVEGPRWGDRRVPSGDGEHARGATRAGRLDGHRRPRGLGVLQLDHGLRGRRPRHPHPQQPQQRGRDRGERVPVAGGRGDPEVHARGLRADGVRGALEGPALHRRGRGRHPAPGAGRPDGLPRLLARGVRRSLAAYAARAGPRQAPGPCRQGARAKALPHTAPVAGLAEHLPGSPMSSDAALVLVSNRGPATFQGGEPRRGGGGLVTALTEGDVEESRAHGGGSFEIQLDGANYRIRFVESDPAAYDRFYNVVANPMLWFIQHYLWDLSNAPDIRLHEIEAYEQGYCRVNGDLAEAVLEEVEHEEEAVVMLHDYHLYVAPKLIRAKRPDLFLHHFVHIPWTQPDAWRVLPSDIREDIYEGVLSNDIVAFHTRSYRRNFLLCCRELFDLEVDERAGVVRFEDRDVWVRSYPLPISADTFQRNAQQPDVLEHEREILRRRRDHLILRVDRADLSKNVLRGFTAFDLFLDQHPEFKEQVTFIAHMMPSRQDVPEYAEYLEKIEALVAVVNHRHGTTDWMPIDLKLRENLPEAIATYKHYHLLMVNAMFDGMNL